MSKKEIRLLSNDIEIRSIDEEEKQEVIVGYALRFNTYSEDLGGFIETIEPTALDNADMDDVVALINHDRNLVLGRTGSNTLKLEVDEFGLKYTIIPPDTTFAKDLMESMKRGDISQSSFGFTMNWEDEDAYGVRYDEDGETPVQIIKKIRSLFDISVVTVPAYQDTQSMVSKRAIEEFEQEREKELQNNITKRKLLIELDL